MSEDQDDVPTLDIHLAWDGMEGKASLQRRGAKDEKGYYTSHQLIDGDVVTRDINVHVDREDYGAEITLSAYHLEASDGEAYHLRVDMMLNWDELRTLRDFLSFIIHQAERPPQLKQEALCRGFSTKRSAG